MPQRIPVFRAARLVGVSRNTLQKKIQQEGADTFEGMIDVADLLKLYPKVDISHDSEYERLQNIKASAFSKRVREHILPDAEVLASRLTDIGHELATTRAHLAMYQSIVGQITARLLEIENNAEHSTSSENTNVSIRKEIHKLLSQIKITLSESEKPTDSARDILAHDTILRIISAHVKIQPSNHEFWLEGNTSLLEAGIRSGLSLNYGCASGNCGLCKARIVSGEVKKIRNHDYVLSEAEKNMNYILMCSCTAVSDVVLEALEAKDENDIPRQEIVTKVKKLEKPTSGYTMLHLQTPRVQRLRFLAGQSVTLSLANGESAEFPIASCPCDDRNLLFHIKTRKDEGIAHAISEKLCKGDEVTVTGPYGHFLFKENSKRTQIYIASDTGFAPVKSLIEHAMALDETSTMYLYRTAEKQEDLYLDNLCRSWSDALDDFHYHPVINADISKIVLEKHINLRDCDVYLAAPQSKLPKIKNLLSDAGLPDKQLIEYSIS